MALWLNPKIRAWINYYGKIRRNSLKPVFYYLHHRLIKWILKKYKRFMGSKMAEMYYPRLSKSILSLAIRLSINLRMTASQEPYGLRDSPTVL